MMLDPESWIALGEKYLKKGFSILPVGIDKRPLIQWRQYQSQRPTIDKVKIWCQMSEFQGFGVITGKISGVIVLDVDVDKGADISGLEIPGTPTVKTGGGYHYYFRYPEDIPVKNRTGILPNVDIRGDGGLAVLPPTKHPNGKLYKWITEPSVKPAKMPRWLRDKLTRQSTASSFNPQVLKGVPEGQRNDSAARIAGKLLHVFPVEDWGTSVWPFLQSCNQRNNPPLPEVELRRVYESIARREMIKRKNNGQAVKHIGEFTVAFKDFTRIEATKGELTYQIRPCGTRVDLILVHNGTLVNRDLLSLVSGRARAVFVNGCASLNKEQKQSVLSDLTQLTVVLEEIDRHILREKPDKQDVPELTDDEKERAKAPLSSPTLLYGILQAIKRLGVAGEEKIALLHYLVLTSRITDDPLSVLVKGESAVGKSFVVSQVLRLFPQDSFIDITDATAQSFFYAPKGHFAHKIIVIFEKHGEEKADYSIRSLQSEKKLKIQVTIKDPKTGQFFSKEHEVEGPAGFITTTTEAIIHQENETRHLSIYPDESVKQTALTFESTDAKYRGVPPVDETLLQLWRNIQRVLKPYPVVIPFVEELRKSFPQKPVRVRRDYGKLLSLLAVITLLHQEQRERTVLHGTEYLIATLVDFHIAKILLEDTLQKTIYALSPKSEQVIEATKKLVPEDGMSSGVSIRDMATELDWDYDTVKKWFEPALQKGFFTILSEHKGSKPAQYKPADKKLPSRTILPDTEDLCSINSEWLGNRKVYDPIVGTIYDLKPDESTDVPTEERSV